MKTGVNVESTLYQQPCKITCQHQHFLFCHTLKIEIVSLISHFSPLTGKKKLFAFQVREEMKICLAVLVSLLGLAAAFLGEGDPAVGKRIEGLVVEAEFEPEGRKRFSFKKYIFI